MQFHKAPQNDHHNLLHEPELQSRTQIVAMTITGNPPKKGNPYGMKSRWFFVLQVAWDSISKLMPLILWFFAQECPGVWGFQPPRGWLVNGGKGKFFLKLTIHRCLEDYFHSHNLAGVSLYLRILRERSQQIYSASETC